MKNLDDVRLAEAVSDSDYTDEHIEQYVGKIKSEITAISERQWDLMVKINAGAIVAGVVAVVLSKTLSTPAKMLLCSCIVMAFAQIIALNLFDHMALNSYDDALDALGDDNSKAPERMYKAKEQVQWIGRWGQLYNSIFALAFSVVPPILFVIGIILVAAGK